MLVPRKDKTPLSLLDIFFTLGVDPGGVLMRAYNAHRFPPYVLTTLSIFLLVCILPPLITAPEALESSAQIILLRGILVTTALTIISTSIFIIVCVKLFNQRNANMAAASLFIYSLAPITTTLGLLYVLNKLFQGDLTVLTFILSGFSRQSDNIVAIYPYALRVGALVSFYILSRGFMIILKASRLLGVFAAIMTIPLILGSYIIALSVNEILHPNLAPQVNSFFGGFIQFPH